MIKRQIRDSAGNIIEKGCIIKIFHFINIYKNRREYMYKQVGKFSKKQNCFKIIHLPIDSKKNISI